MILYGSTFSPYVRKVAAVLAEKDIAFESVAVGAGSRDPAFLAASPLGKMPAIDDGGFTLADSSAIVHYLEAKRPAPALIPVDPQRRGRAIWWDEWGDTVLMGAARKVFFNRVVAPVFLKREGDAAAADAAVRDELPAVFDYLEGEAPDEGWLLGRFTLADIAATMPLINLGYAGAGLDPARHPKSAALLERVMARPSIAPLVARERRALERLRGA